jgi:hypothetical protein
MAMHAIPHGAFMIEAYTRVTVPVGRLQGFVATASPPVPRPIALPLGLTWKAMNQQALDALLEWHGVRNLHLIHTGFAFDRKAYA